MSAFPGTEQRASPRRDPPNSCSIGTISVRTQLGTISPDRLCRGKGATRTDTVHRPRPNPPAPKPRPNPPAPKTPVGSPVRPSRKSARVVSDQKRCPHPDGAVPRTGMMTRPVARGSGNDNNHNNRDFASLFWFTNLRPEQTTWNFRYYSTGGRTLPPRGSLLVRDRARARTTPFVSRARRQSSREHAI